MQTDARARAHTGARRVTKGTREGAATGRVRRTHPSCGGRWRPVEVGHVTWLDLRDIQGSWSNVRETEKLGEAGLCPGGCDSA